MTALLKTDLILIRPTTPNDIPFIYSTWNRAYYGGNRSFKNTFKDESIFFNYQSRVIDYLLGKSNVKIPVAVLKDDPDVILGYAVHEGPIVHWVFVKEDWRRIGLTKMLLPFPIEAVTHLTFKGRAILREKQPNAVFDPFLI